MCACLETPVSFPGVNTSLLIFLFFPLSGERSFFNDLVSSSPGLQESKVGQKFEFFPNKNSKLPLFRYIIR